MDFHPVKVFKKFSFVHYLRDSSKLNETNCVLVGARSLCVDDDSRFGKGRAGLESSTATFSHSKIKAFDSVMEMSSSPLTSDLSSKSNVSESTEKSSGLSTSFRAFAKRHFAKDSSTPKAKETSFYPRSIPPAEGVEHEEQDDTVVMATNSHLDEMSWRKRLGHSRALRLRKRLHSDGIFEVKKTKCVEIDRPSKVVRRTEPRRKPIQYSTNMREVLQNKYQRGEFRDFLCKEFSEENLDFWLDVEKYKKSNQRKRLEISEKIFAKYIEKHSPREINLAATERRSITNSLHHPHQSTFDAAQKAIFKLMERDSFQRFLALKVRRHVQV